MQFPRETLFHKRGYQCAGRASLLSERAATEHYAATPGAQSHPHNQPPTPAVTPGGRLRPMGADPDVCPS